MIHSLYRFARTTILTFHYFIHSPKGLLDLPPPPLPPCFSDPPPTVTKDLPPPPLPPFTLEGKVKIEADIGLLPPPPPLPLLTDLPNGGGLGGDLPPPPQLPPALGNGSSNEEVDVKPELKMGTEETAVDMEVEAKAEGADIKANTPCGEDLKKGRYKPMWCESALVPCGFLSASQLSCQLRFTIV